MPGWPLQPHRGLTLAEVVTDGVLEAAFAWLCQQRRDWPAAADVWRFRHRWPEETVRLRAELLAGTYEVGLLSRVTLRNGEEVDLWAARDAVVMQALALVPPAASAAVAALHASQRPWRTETCGAAGAGSPAPAALCPKDRRQVVLCVH